MHQKELLNDPGQRVDFKIGSINDLANGILLCWPCHKVFDASLVCIDADRGTLLVVADALLTNEERWATLKGNEVRERSHFWPSKQLLKFREDALRAATERRHKMQESYSFFCKHCKRSFMQVSALGKHENKCTGRQRTASTYLSPYSKGPSAVEDDEEYL